MFIKAQDAVLLASLLSSKRPASQADAADGLGLGVGEVNRSLRRLAAAGLVQSAPRIVDVQVVRPAALVAALKQAMEPG